MWRADFSGSSSVESGFSGAVWVPAVQALQRDVWAAGHFECLAPLGLAELSGDGFILPATLGALLEAAGSVDEPSDMVRAIQEATPGDGFLSEVLKSVQDSEEASWRDFFYDDQWRLLFYQRAGDAAPPAYLCAVGLSRGCVTGGSWGERDGGASGDCTHSGSCGSLLLLAGPTRRCCALCAHVHHLRGRQAFQQSAYGFRGACIFVGACSAVFSLGHGSCGSVAFVTGG